MSYRRVMPVSPRPEQSREIETLPALRARLDSGAPLTGLRLQGLDLTSFTDELLGREDLGNLVVLGGRLSVPLEEHLREHGAVIFPASPTAPVRPYRGSLYTATELYDGLARDGYGATTDARAHQWAQDAALRHDVYVSVLRAIHDDAMSDALVDLVTDRPVVGILGGHAIPRGTAQFARAAQVGHQLAEAGYLVATGGGPGAMEAVNLGAWARDEQTLADALTRLAAVPLFSPDIGAWARVGLRITATDNPEDRADHPRSIGIPTWHYGQEPPNVFADLIAKFFSNALREDLLLHLSSCGLVVLPGAAGTVQEVFQMATRLYYQVDGRRPPMVLVGVDHWTQELPVWPLLEALGAGRPMGQAIRLVPDVDAAVNALMG